MAAISAVVGCTALRDSFWADEGIQIDLANVSLAHQLSWFKELFLPKFCHTHSGNTP